MIFIEIHTILSIDSVSLEHLDCMHESNSTWEYFQCIHLIIIYPVLYRYAHSSKRNTISSIVYHVFMSFERKFHFLLLIACEKGFSNSTSWVRDSQMTRKADALILIWKAFFVKGARGDRHKYREMSCESNSLIFLAYWPNRAILSNWHAIKSREWSKWNRIHSFIHLFLGFFRAQSLLCSDVNACLCVNQGVNLTTSFENSLTTLLIYHHFFYSSAWLTASHWS